MDCNKYVSDDVYIRDLKEYPDLGLLEDCIKKVSDYHSVMLHMSGKVFRGKCDQLDLDFFLRCVNQLWDNCSILHSVLVDVAVWAYKTKGYLPTWDMWYCLFMDCTSVKILAADVFHYSTELCIIPYDEEVLDLVKGKEEM